MTLTLYLLGVWMNYLSFTAKDIKTLGLLFKNLHACFSEFKKQEGSNRVGITFPDMGLDDTGLVINVFGQIQYLLTIQSQKGIAKLIASGKVSSFASSVESTCTYKAYIRDRRLERGSPAQSMARLKSGNHKNNEQFRQFSMYRYFNTTLPAINMQSSGSKRNFTIYISTLESDAPVSEYLEFNAYGLSNSSSPSFLPCIKKDI